MVNDAKLQVYKCPSCGGAIRYDATTGTLACRWCGNEYNAAQLAVKEVDVCLQGYLCPECGAELMHDDFIAADICPYCGNNEIAPRRFEGAFAPAYVIPFALTKSQAIDCYEKLVAEKKFLPEDYEKEARVISTQGTYVPFWLNEGTVDFDFTFWCNDGAKTNAENKHFRVMGSYDYARVPADGSKRMADDMMDSIEPYDYSALVPFATEYLPGFVAERYTVDEDEVLSRVDVRVKNTAMTAAGNSLESKWKHKFPTKNRSSAQVRHGNSKQVLLPVWLFVVLYKGGKYLVGVNGQTGKVAVNFPIDQGKERKILGRETGKDILMTLSVFAVVAIAIAIGCVHEGISISNVNFASIDPGELAFIVAIAVLFLAMLIIFAVQAFASTKRDVKTSMHNVEEASDADAFVQEGKLNVTLLEKGKGPKRDQDNWPENEKAI